jgi:predicted RNA polymerase sigma factor
MLLHMKPVEESLLAKLHEFTAVVRSRVGDPHLAQDLVQDSLVKALASPNQPTTTEDTITWFYRILRHSIIDLYRRNATRNNLTVRLHRARKHLREALSNNCRACAKHGCLDCTCAGFKLPGS